MRAIACAVLAAAALLLAGCSTAEFYFQGITGEVDLLSRARPIAAVLANARDPVVRAKLERVVAIRDFASRELGLPENLSYRRYTEIERRFVTWNVFAAPQLSLSPLQWCFPIAGCVNYRGYFNEADARSEAARLAADGDDVYIGGVPAFSTLGYFADPMLSTFIRYPDVEIARLIFHELAHQVLYAKDDTVFNESYAVTVEEEGLRRWLAAQHDPELDRQYALSERYRTTFRALIERARERLAKLYTSDASIEAKRVGKAEAFAAMREAYEATKRAWGGFSVYDYWFQQGPNNASLAAVALYTQKVPEFQALLAAEGGDLPSFYARVKQLAALPKGQRETALAEAAGVKGSRSAP
ncbi:MAG TPA: aminopeptidase [Casimicrobiaceae bacterium]|nr:aminopeptidase [Casimicrobiaceae bacterium]